MTINHRLIRMGGLLALAVLTHSSARSAPATLTTLYSFTAENGDGAGPYAGVVLGTNGALYGTTSYGGTFNSGAVFALTPPAIQGGPWTETVIHSFGGGADGAYPYAGLVVGPGGELYGTTNFGGVSSEGIVFELSPPTTPGGAWTETVLYSFSGPDGAYPYAAPTLAPSGALYGTTELGGASGYGTAFVLTPPSALSGAWTETVIHSFTGLADGGCPYASLTIGAKGTLYGTTNIGGATQKGVVFKLTPPSAGGAWAEKVIHSFKGGSEGGFPYAGVTVDTHGVVYGTTAGSVNAGGGTAFILTPPSSGSTTWTETMLHSFTGNADGGTPHATLTPGTNGTLYGTAFGGGIGKRFSGQGLIFELTPPSAGGGWAETVPYEFHGTDGGEPNAPLVPDGTVMYGTTFGGGPEGHGTVFAFTP